MLKIPIHTHPFVVGVYQPMKRVAVDTIGPLPIDESGYQYIIVLICCFSRYTVLFPAVDAKAVSAARALLWWMAYFGTMNQILSDMGTQYVNQILDELVKFTGVNKLDTMPGIHEENGIVERRNKEVMRHLTAIVNHRKIKSKWSDNLPLVQRIINSEPMDGLNASPAQIIFGNAVDLDRGIFLDKHPDTGEDLSKPDKIKNLSEWMAKMLQSQADVIKVAEETQSKIHKEYFERFPSIRTEFQIGSYVLVNYGDNRPPSKLHTKWHGPYRVIKQDELNKNRYTVQNLVTGKLEDFPNGQMKPYIVSEHHQTPDVVAMYDEDYEIVEKVVSHEPKRLHGTPKSKIFFFIRYKGDDNTKPPTKVSYANLRDNEALHEYLTKIKAVSLIPAKYKWGREGPPSNTSEANAS
jgi:hypothetical protein